MNMSRNFFVAVTVARSRSQSDLLRATVTATKTSPGLQDTLISRYVTLRNDPCNLCRNGSTRLRDKLQEKLPSVTAASVAI